MLRNVPLRYNFFLAFLFCLPLINFGIYSNNYNLDLWNFSAFFSKTNILEKFLTFFPYLVYLSMFFLKRWAWILLTEYAVVFLSFSIYDYNNNLGNREFSLVLALFIAGILIYKKDLVKIAYREDFLAKGWREARRFPLSVPVRIGENEFHTIDISYSGLALENSGKNFPQESELEILIHFPEEIFRVICKLARQTDKISGFAFQNMDRQKIKNLKRHINKNRIKEYLTFKNTTPDQETSAKIR